MDWIGLLLAAADIADHSHDPSRKNGALVLVDGLVIASGWNRLPAGVVDSPARWVRPAKYLYVEHAERNALYNAVRDGFTLEGSVLVCPWAACADCARAIIGLGVGTLVRDKARMAVEDPHWTPEIRAGDAMLREAGVEIVDV